jgi:endonuclease-3 related protein
MQFGRVRDRLLREHGPQGWWPAESRFEIMVGALLVQRTTWGNTERAIAGLKDAGLLGPAELAAADLDTLHACVRPAGFFRTKSERLKKLAAFVRDAGGIEVLAKQPTTGLRETLLGLPGVGAETADAILLYVFGRPVVVVDTYLRRVAARLAGTRRPVPDSSIVEAVLSEISAADELSEFHALIVAHAKQHCRSAPRCGACSVSSVCRTASA